MNELVTLISQKTGLSSDMSQKVLGVVEGYLKDKLPEPVASQVTSALGGQTGGVSPSSMAGAENQATNQGKGFLGNLFGKSENQPTEH